VFERGSGYQAQVGVMLEELTQIKDDFLEEERVEFIQPIEQ